MKRNDYLFQSHSLPYIHSLQWISFVAVTGCGIEQCDEHAS